MLSISSCWIKGNKNKNIFKKVYNPYIILTLHMVTSLMQVKLII